MKRRMVPRDRRGGVQARRLEGWPPGLHGVAGASRRLGSFVQAWSRAKRGPLAMEDSRYTFAVPRGFTPPVHRNTAVARRTFMSVHRHGVALRYLVVTAHHGRLRHDSASVYSYA